MYSTGDGLLFAGYLLGMGVWIFVSYRHKPGKEVMQKLPLAVRWTLVIPFMEIWRSHLDKYEQTEMERFLVFFNCLLIYFSWGPLILAYIAFSSIFPLTAML